MTISVMPSNRAQHFFYRGFHLLIFAGQDPVILVGDPDVGSSWWFSVGLIFVCAVAGDQSGCRRRCGVYLGLPPYGRSGACYGHADQFADAQLFVGIGGTLKASE